MCGGDGKENVRSEVQSENEENSESGYLVSEAIIKVLVYNIK